MVLVRLQLYRRYPGSIVVELERDGRVVETLVATHVDEAVEYITKAVRKAVKEDMQKR